MLRWSLRLSEFDFTVQHSPGTQTRHAHALRKAVQRIAHDRDISREEVKREQAGDKFCQSLEVGPAKGKSENFAVEDGVIYRRRKNEEHQLVVPSSLATKIIALKHDPLTVAHPGRTRTLDILCLRFYWPGMRQDVELYVKHFHACHRLKPRHEFKAPLGDVSEPAAPFEVTAMYFLGPFPVTASKNR